MRAVLEHALHAVRIGHEVRREITAIELHAFDDVQRGLDGFGFFDRDDAIFADLLHRFGDDVADCRIVVGGNGRDLRDHVALHRLRQFFDLFGTATSTARSMPRFTAIGFAPAATVFTPSRKMA